MKFRKGILITGLGLIGLLWITSLILSNTYVFRLHHAAETGDVAGVAAELGRHTDPSEADEDGITPVHAALAGPDSTERAVLEQLVAAGADINKSSARGWTPLHFAAYLRDTMALRILLAHGADTLYTNPDGKTPLMLAEEVANVWRGISPRQEALNNAVVGILKSNVCSTAPPAQSLANHRLKYNRVSKKRWLPAYFMVRARLVSGGTFSPLMWVLIFVGVWVIVREFVKGDNSKIVRVLFFDFSLLISVYVVWTGIILSFFIETAHIPSLSMYPGLQVGDHIIASRWHRWQALGRGDVVIFNPLPEEELNADVYVVKRIIGIPGDVVEVVPARLLIHDTLQTPAMRGNVPLHAWLREKLGLPGTATIKIGSDNTLTVSGITVPLQRLADSLHVPAGSISLSPGFAAVNDRKLNEPYIAEDMDQGFRGYEVPQGTVFVMGDNRNRSIDSRIWGPVETDQVVGRVQYKYWPFARAGKIVP